MRLGLPSRLRPLLALCAFALWAQDAGMVLRTSVSYTTQRNTLPLSGEQRREAERLGNEAQRAMRESRYPDAMRLFHQGLAVMHKVEWTPAVELASSLQAKVNHAMLEPGGSAEVTLLALYKSARAPAQKLTAAVFLLPLKKNGTLEKSLAPRAPVDPAHLPLSIPVFAPESANGDYQIEVRVAQADGSVPENGRMAFVKELPVHIEPLAAPLAKLRDRVARLKNMNHPALATAEYVVTLFERADRGDANPHRFSFSHELRWADSILEALEGGHDPFAGKHGDFRRAYRSPVDQTLQPYRIFVPPSYDGTRTVPLLVALHGMGGDENSMLDGYKEALRPEAERLGFLVVCPKGRDAASMYRGSAEQDVLDVIAEVRRAYRVDANRIYLMGHSMGAFGTWELAMRHPEMFAALGPISGGGDPQGMERIRHIPQYVVHGDNDKTVPVARSRAMVEAGKKLGTRIVYVEVPGGSHGDVAAPEFPHMLDFFARQRREGP